MLGNNRLAQGGFANRGCQLSDNPAPLLVEIELPPMKIWGAACYCWRRNWAGGACNYKPALNIREQCVWVGSGILLFRHDGIVEKINPYQQTGRAKELGIDILDEKRLF